MTTERKPVQKIEIKPGAHIHFMGICGTAMASLAGLLKDRGFKVTGSDQNVYPPMSTQLQKIGIPIMQGFKAENLTTAGKPDLVIVGNVISRQFEEAQALLASDIPFTSLPQAMGQIVIDHRHCMNVSGTHGKTTTTSMLAWITDQLGLKPGFMIGGIPKNFDLSYRVPHGDWFVIEGDEYDTAFFDKVPKFTHYRPRSIILTSVEFDHADIYRDLEHVKEAFQMLLKLLPESGVLVTAAGDVNIADLLKRESALLAKGGRKVLTFGLEGTPGSGADFVA
jgi:UDP-N-acetylmuramate: L-alanyl-gamma-D-glutamyl-meso-diaminopimelate ligase